AEREFLAIETFDEAADGIEHYVRTWCHQNFGTQLHRIPQQTGIQWFITRKIGVHEESIGKLILEQFEGYFCISVVKNQSRMGFSQPRWDYLVNSILKAVGTMSRSSRFEVYLNENHRSTGTRLQEAANSFFAKLYKRTEHEQIEQPDVPQPWERIPDYRWDRKALQLWLEGAAVSEIAKKVKRQEKLYEIAFRNCVINMGPN
ncbi:MAG TPA: hypothetical protein VFU22_18130, partial [Roseiflexaceae bacterium]|nr:hypothetical protein [Roseiflexaceae bacterium]